MQRHECVIQPKTTTSTTTPQKAEKVSEKMERETTRDTYKFHWNLPNTVLNLVHIFVTVAALALHPMMETDRPRTLL